MIARKKRALASLWLQLMVLVVVNVMMIPQLHYFMGKGTTQQAVNLGYGIGQALGKFMGNKLWEFGGFVLILA